VRQLPEQIWHIEPFIKTYPVEQFDTQLEPRR